MAISSTEWFCIAVTRLKAWDKEVEKLESTCQQSKSEKPTTKAPNKKRYGSEHEHCHKGNGLDDTSLSTAVIWDVTLIESIEDGDAHQKLCDIAVGREKHDDGT